MPSKVVVRKRFRYRRFFFLLITVVVVANVVFVSQLFHDVEKKKNQKTVKLKEQYTGQCNVVRNTGWKKWTEFDAEAYLKSVAVPPNGDAFARHQFDQRASDATHHDRILPDSRHPKCERHYSENIFRDNMARVPTVSVIMTFHNEARSALLRTIVSVLRRTKAAFLCEILLVDDFSDDPSDGTLLTEIEPVVLLRNEQREGLVRSRNRGAENAHGDVLVFLDSHCEANEGWLEALLVPLLENRQRVLSPVIDVIDQHTFQYRATESSLRGAFNWDLVFKWEQLPGSSLSRHRLHPEEPFPTPMFAGGLFAIWRSYFFEIGAYDGAMLIWGGENVEMSLRVWQCGGRLEIAPCSRIGHVFRSAHPYPFPGGGSGLVFARNNKRAAEVWLDDYSMLFYDRNAAAKQIDAGDLTERHALRAKLQCKSFEWFLQNVYPELKVPPEFAIRRKRINHNLEVQNNQNQRNVEISGALSQGAFCIRLWTKDRSPVRLSNVTGSLRMLQCSASGTELHFEFDNSGTLQVSIAGKPYCLTANEPLEVYSTVSLAPCEGRVMQKWTRAAVNKQPDAFIFRLASFDTFCLGSRADPMARSPPIIVIDSCNPSFFSQHWRFRIKH